MIGPNLVSFVRLFPMYLLYELYLENVLLIPVLVYHQLSQVTLDLVECNHLINLF